MCGWGDGFIDSLWRIPRGYSGSDAIQSSLGLMQFEARRIHIVPLGFILFSSPCSVHYIFPTPSHSNLSAVKQCCNIYAFSDNLLFLANIFHFNWTEDSSNPSCFSIHHRKFSSVDENSIFLLTIIRQADSRLEAFAWSPCVCTSFLPQILNVNLFAFAILQGQ